MSSWPKLYHPVEGRVIQGRKVNGVEIPSYEKGKSFRYSFIIREQLRKWEERGRGREGVVIMNAQTTSRGCSEEGWGEGKRKGKQRVPKDHSVGTTILEKKEG